MINKKTILVIDDEADLVKILKFRLEKNGYRVATAYDGEAGLVLANEVKPDLIILDITMPKMGGLEFYKRVLTERGKPKFPILVLTARGELKDLFKEIQADGFMSKPFEIDELLKTAERIITTGNDSTVILMDFNENPLVQEIRKIFMTERCKVVIAESFEMLREACYKEKPDYIFMEYMQASQKGDEMIAKVKGFLSSQFDKAQQTSGKIPIIVYSYSGFDYKEKSLNAGADMYLGKPERYEEFIRALREWDIKERNG